MDIYYFENNQECVRTINSDLIIIAVWVDGGPFFTKLYLRLEGETRGKTYIINTDHPYHAFMLMELSFLKTHTYSNTIEYLALENIMAEFHVWISKFTSLGAFDDAYTEAHEFIESEIEASRKFEEDVFNLYCTDEVII